MNKLEGGLKAKGLPNKHTGKNEPLVSIITPVYNGEEFLEEAIKSVLNQTYDNIEYIIVDGGSEDRTLNIIRRYENEIAYWISEPDNGMYDAINKGFRTSTGDILAYLNADDKYYHSAVEMVVKVFNKYPEIKWITGIPTFYDQNGLIVGIEPMVYYFRRFLSMGLYRPDLLGAIQQESSFWRRNLWETVGGARKDLRFAGDYDLWIRFSNHAHLYVIPTILGGFRRHSGQTTGDIRQYYAECRKVKRVKFEKIWRTLRLPIKMGSMIVVSYKMYQVGRKRANYPPKRLS